jgi:molecular chaperone GrpE (heat shock protein)
MTPEQADQLRTQLKAHDIATAEERRERIEAEACDIRDKHLVEATELFSSLIPTALDNPLASLDALATIEACRRLNDNEKRIKTGLIMLHAFRTLASDLRGV